MEETIMNILEAKHLKKIYGSGSTAVHALDDVNLSIAKGDFVAIIGTSGSGKAIRVYKLVQSLHPKLI